MNKLEKMIKLEDPKDVKYPASREMFKFIRQIIIKIMNIEDPDQLLDGEVGKLAGYGSDETSRLKHGNIKFDSVRRALLLNKNLDVDEYLILRVATGKLKADQAFKIWEMGFELKDKYRKESLLNYLKEQKIPYKLVILNSEE